MLSRRQMLVYYKLIEEEFGIEEKDLHWTDKVALSNYLESVRRTKEIPGMTKDSSAIELFMRDRFELPYIELRKMAFPRRGVFWELEKSKKKLNSVPRFSRYIGSDFCGKEDFKQYCRNNVDFWRDQRNLI